MDEYINELIQIGLGNVIDLSVDEYIVKDNVYQGNMTEAGKILDKIRENLSEEKQTLLDEYMDYIMNANERACTLAYLIGAKNTMKFIKE